MPKETAEPATRGDWHFPTQTTVRGLQVTKRPEAHPSRFPLPGTAHSALCLQPQKASVGCGPTSSSTIFLAPKEGMEGFPLWRRGRPGPWEETTWQKGRVIHPSLA